MKLGFIGAGNMATAMMKGFISGGAVPAREIAVCDVKAEAAKALEQECGVFPCRSSRELTEQSELVFLAVKPQVMEPVLREIAPALAAGGQTAVSIAAGVTLETLQDYTGLTDCGIPFIRVMPNVNMLVGQSMSAVCPDSLVPPEITEYVLSLLGSVGRAVRLPEKDFAAFTAIAGCSPAYACLFVDSLARAAVKHGLPKKLATEIAAQAVLGSATLLLDTGENPWEIIDRVCSPGGTTIAGLMALQNHAFPAAAAAAVDAAVDRDRELSNQ